MCGLYSKQDLQEIVELIEDDKLEINNSQKCGCKVLQLVQKLDAEIIDIANEYDGYEEGMFLNMNKPEDFELVRGRMNLSS